MEMTITHLNKKNPASPVTLTLQVVVSSNVITSPWQQLYIPWRHVIIGQFD